MERYRIGWKRGGKWKYIVVTGRAAMLAEVADKICLSDHVTVKCISK